MLGVTAGGDRQALHEVIRRHSLAVADAVSAGRSPTTCWSGSAPTPHSRGIPAADLRAELEPANYTGRAARQVGEFLEEYLRPLLARARPLAAEAGSGGGESMTAPALAESRLPLPLLRRGKVREVYEVDADAPAARRQRPGQRVRRRDARADPRKGRRAHADERVLVPSGWRGVVPSHFITARRGGDRGAASCARVTTAQQIDGPRHAGAPHRAGAVRVRGARLSLRLGLGRVPGYRYPRRRALAGRVWSRARGSTRRSSRPPPRRSPGTIVNVTVRRRWPRALGRELADQAAGRELRGVPRRPRPRGRPGDHHRGHQVRVRPRRRRRRSC